MTMTLWTVGHSNRTLPEFIALVQSFGIEAIADVRRYPGSRRLPHFGQEALRAALAEHEIRYEWFAELGGRRRSATASPNDAWENASFRAYADHLATPEFAASLERLLALAKEARTAIMCSEVLWWRCHRRLIADVLVVRGYEVIHILGPGESTRHVLAPPGHLVGGRLSYALTAQ